VPRDWTSLPWPVSVIAKPPRQPQVDDPWDQLVVMLGAEVLDRAAEQPPLDAGLDQQRQVGMGEQLEAGDRGAQVATTTVRDREAGSGLPRAGQRLQLGGHPRPVLVTR